MKKTVVKDKKEAKPKKKVTKNKSSKIKNDSKKSSEQKETQKRLVEKNNSNEVLKDAPVEKYFILTNGQPIKNIKELADTLEEIREEVYQHHVNQHKNDFSTWIKHVFEEHGLADELAQIKDKDHMRLVIYKHITHKLAGKK